MLIKIARHHARSIARRRDPAKGLVHLGHHLPDMGGRTNEEEEEDDGADQLELDPLATCEQKCEPVLAIASTLGSLPSSTLADSREEAW